MGRVKRSDVFGNHPIVPKQSLRKGESYLADRGLYYCYYYDEEGKRKRLTSKTLEGLRRAKVEVDNLLANRIRTAAKTLTLDSVYAEWISIKRGIAERSRQNYTWTYEHYCQGTKLGKTSVQDLTKGKIRDHYNKLKEQKKLSAGTINTLQTVVVQVLGYAVDERYILSNPATGCMYEIMRNEPQKQAHPALTKEEQERLISFIRNSSTYSHWLPVFKVLLQTGMRCGELGGLTWDDVDMENEKISINHSLQYHKNSKSFYLIDKPKTKAGKRVIPMLGDVKECLAMQRKIIEEKGITSMVVPGTENVDKAYYTDFVFPNANGGCHYPTTLNKALQKIVRDANVEAMDNEVLVMLPKISCHNFRSTFITNCAMAGIDIAVTQKICGHELGSKLTEQIYTTVNPEWQLREVDKLNKLLENL